MLIIVNPGNLKYNLVNHVMISSKKSQLNLWMKVSTALLDDISYFINIKFLN